MVPKEGTMFDELRKRPIQTAAAAAVAAIAILNGIPPLVDEYLPWYGNRLGGVLDLLPSLVVSVVIGAAVYFALQYSRYRSALRKVTRDYIVDVQDWMNRADPAKYPGTQSEPVKRGEASADPEWGNQIVGRYGLPPEREYR
jgi:hypothetical protein